MTTDSPTVICIDCGPVEHQRDNGDDQAHCGCIAGWVNAASWVWSDILLLNFTLVRCPCECHGAES